MTDHTQASETELNVPHEGVHETDTAAETGTHEADAPVLEGPEAKIAELEAALAEMKDRWVRAEAETQNARNRAKRDVEDARQYAVQKFARDTVEAAENLGRALAALPAQAEGEDAIVTTLREGIAGTERSFLGILERHGVTSEDPTGQPFDANKHQAMAEQPSDSHPSGHVMQAWTPAWLLKGRLLKPAMVVVAKGGAAAPAPGLDTTA